MRYNESAAKIYTLREGKSIMSFTMGVRLTATDSEQWFSSGSHTRTDICIPYTLLHACSTHIHTVTTHMSTFNAKTPNAEDYEVAKELTKEILNIASCLQPRENSISWFEFEKHIHQLGR